MNLQPVSTGFPTPGFTTLRNQPALNLYASPGEFRKMVAMPSDQPLGIYVHIPFCQRKCFYCDFNSGPAGELKRQRHLKALEQEIRNSPWRGSSARTVFFGGGTPSELSLDELSRLVQALGDSFDLSGASEWSIECNPGTLTPQSLGAYRRMGFNRISLGAQSFQDKFLKALGRVHDAAQAIEAIGWIGQAGFDNLNLDLIFALPGQSLAQWQADLERALAFQPQHLSLYQLTIEKNTEFGRLRDLGRFQETDEDACADMYEMALDLTQAAGYRQYEISNFALPGRRCLHNWIYWRNQPYLGFGVSAASYVNGLRWTNCADWESYAAAAPSDRIPLDSQEKLPPQRALAEEIMLGLRTAQGVSMTEVSGRYGIDAARAYSETIAFLAQEGLIERSSDRICLTRRGMLLANSVCAEFLEAADESILSRVS